MGGHLPAGARDRGPAERPAGSGRLNAPARLLYLLPAAAHAGLIFYLSSLSNLRVPIHVRDIDKLAHGSVYAVLAVLLAWGLARVFPGWSRARVLAVAFLLPVAYGVSDEFSQHFVPGRSVEVLDVAADAGGALLVVAFLAWRGRRARSRTRAPG